MIAERYITEWSDNFPWTKNSFVEQDMGDVDPLLRRGVTFNPHEAYSAFKEIVLPHIWISSESYLDNRGLMAVYLVYFI